jgi:hypothetical protein
MKSIKFLISTLSFLLTASMEAQILWGGPGVAASEFSGGLNGWTTVGVTCSTAVWVWESDGKADKGAYSAGSGDRGIKSPSVSNGAMVFDSDFYDNGGKQGNEFLGKGSCPAPHAAELISPIMNLAGKGSMSLKFNQFFRNYEAETKVAYSTDGGNSWSNPVDVNPLVPRGQSTVDSDVKLIPLKGAVGTDKFRVKFIFDGDYYFWIIDDVQIVTRPVNDLRVNRDWFAIAPNYMTPSSQVEKFGFLADIENVGATAQPNVKLNLTIRTDPGGVVVYTESKGYGTVKSDTLVENISFGGFTPPSKKERYVASYLISSDSVDSNRSNDTITWRFEVSDTIFAKEFRPTTSVRPGNGNWEAGEKHSWAYGNFFHVPKGAGIKANSCTFALVNGAEIKGEQIFLKLYKWNDLNQNGSVEASERMLVGLNLYDVKGTENGTAAIRVPLFDISFENPPVLQNATSYIMMVEFTPSKLGLDMLLLASEDHDYGAMILNSIQMNAPRYAGVLAINDPLDNETFSTRGFGWDIVPYVRLNISQSLTATTELSANNRIELFPNPANEMLNVKLELEKLNQQVQLSVFDLNGRLLLQEAKQGVKSDVFQISTDNLSNGTYVLFLKTESGTATRKFAVQH